MEQLRLVVIGCGAITRLIHLPVLSESPDFRVAGLVDVQLDHADELAASHGVPWTGTDHREAIGRADAAILAVPHNLHAPIAMELLRSGVHTLVEKPMALRVSDCDQMIAAAVPSGAVLAVGLVRRFYEPYRRVAAILRSSELGRVQHFEVSEGGLYRWPMRSGFAFDHAQAGGGVLVNLGVHALDLLSWWLGPVEWVEYRDDAEGGVEAECQIRMRFENGAEGDVLVTQLRDVPDRCRLECERGTLLIEDGGSNPAARLSIISDGQERAVAEGHSGPGPTTRLEAFGRQLEDFASAIRTGRDPVVPGREGRHSVELLGRCYEARTPLSHPWET